jgi:Na+-driven multidrug efflux pump
MSEDQRELVHREKSSNGLILVVGLFFLLLLYILSPPFAYLLFKDPSNESFRTLYMPLIYLSGQYDPIQEFYNWYGQLFPWIP